eukprot:TRINITY_DN3008_c0_g1_i1.p1 TRINITY_DN3008_c0_g1~~TRINITY_DN3008_c0_g1_i1.p1  ORF type:complete len:304 (-),score=70.53 TRINITY_DN3008_c0_g1_i1:119-1030(-)
MNAQWAAGPADEDLNMLNVFILDHLQKNGFDDAAKSFFLETMNEYYEPPIDSANSFLATWFESAWNGLVMSRRSADPAKKEDVPPRRDAPAIIPQSAGSAFRAPASFALERERSIATLNSLSGVFQHHLPVPPFLPSLVPSAPILPQFQTPMPKIEATTEESEPQEATISAMSRQIVKNGKACFQRLNLRRRAEQEETNSKVRNDTLGHRVISSQSGPDTSVDASRSRASKFRGVSRNGNQWQAIIMVANRKRYIGSYSQETDAATAYDKAALQFHGERAKTNFTYTFQEMDSIRREEPILPD